MRLIQSLALSGQSLRKTLVAAAAIALRGLVSAAPASAGPITITGSYTTAVTLDGTADQVNTLSDAAGLLSSSLNGNRRRSSANGS